jgi:hypothetical protein
MADTNPNQSHVDSLKKEYDRLAEAVHETAPNTPERHRAMEAKKAAFLKFKAADDAKTTVDVATTDAERKQQTAEAAAKDAEAAKKAAAETAKSQATAVRTGRANAGPNDPAQQPQDTAPKQRP